MTDRMRAAASGSVLVRGLRRAVAALARVLAGAGRASGAVVGGMRAFDRGVERALAARREDEAERERRVREVLRESRLIQMLDRLFALPAVAWPSSAVGRQTTRLANDVRALERWQQVRLAGWMLLVGLAARVGSYLLMGESAGWITASVWSGVALFAVVLMVWCREVAVAWDERRARWKKRESGD